MVWPFGSPTFVEVIQANHSTPVSTHLPSVAERSTASQTFCVWSAVRKVGSAGRAGLDAAQEIGQRMHEGVLVADRQARHPPVVHVRVLEAGDVDLAPAGQVAVDLVAGGLGGTRRTASHWLSCRSNASEPSAPFSSKVFKRLVAAGVASALERCPSTPLAKRARNAQASSMPTGCSLPGLLVHALLDEGLGRRRPRA